MSRGVNRTVKFAGFAALLATPALMHMALFHSQSHVLPLAFLILQLGGLGLILFARAKPWIKGVATLAIGAAVGLIGWHFGVQGVVASTGLSHATIHIALLTLFGASLLKDREPLVTSVIRRVRGTLPPELLRYGRQVTILWCGFFAIQLLTSLILLLTAPLAAWSFFINILSYPLVFVLFISEFVFHKIRFRHLPRSRVKDLVKALAGWRTLMPAKGTATG